MLLPVMGMLSLSSCGTLNLLHSDVRSLLHDARIVGRVVSTSTERVRVFICKKNAPDGTFAIADSASPNSMGDFAFMLPNDKSYFVAAVKEAKSNDQPHDKEMVSFYGGEAMKEIPAGTASDSETLLLDFALKIHRENPAARALRRALQSWNPAQTRASGSVPIACGEIISLDDALFNAEAGEKGMWAPLTAAKRDGLGVYFLKPYDHRKVPVIFVHGIGGTPRCWKSIVQSLDENGYQAWVYSYPSGIPIESAAKGLTTLSGRLHSHYGFRKMHIVAHSMGGLVARRSVQMICNEEQKGYVSSLTTISTPWNGVSFAAVGSVGLSSPVPSWLDLRPNSKFIRKVLDDPMPVPHLLISTEKSRFRFTLPRRNDGTVSLASQMDPRAVSRSSASIRVPQDHDGVLEVRETMQSLKSFLSTLL